MRNLSGYLLILLFVGGLVSCQKEIDGSLDSGTINPNADSYMPVAPNAYWKYKDSASGTLVSTVVTNKTKTYNSIPFNVVLSTSGGRTDSAYYAVHGPDYYLLADQDVSPSGVPVHILFHFLNDTASVGYSWKYNAGHGNGFTAYIETTIMEKGISHTVAGKTYPDVIHTKLVLSYDVMGTVIPMGTYDYYTAKGVGIIRVRTLIDAYGLFMRASSDLIEYRIP